MSNNNSPEEAAKTRRMAYEYMLIARRVMFEMSGFTRLVEKSGMLKNNKFPVSREEALRRLSHVVADCAGSPVRHYLGATGLPLVINFFAKSTRRTKDDDDRWIMSRLKKASLHAAQEGLRRMGRKASHEVRVTTCIKISDSIAKLDGQAKIILEVVVPIRYSEQRRSIGDIGNNKMLVSAKKIENGGHPYKTWEISFITYKYGAADSGKRFYFMRNHYYMRDDASGVIYIAENMKSCAAGMKMAIARKIAKRIGT